MDTLFGRATTAQLLASLPSQLEEWNAKFENDTEAKTQELEDLKAKRAADLSRLQGTYVAYALGRISPGRPSLLICALFPSAELSDQFKEYEKVCLQDRKRKRKMREAAERWVTFSPQRAAKC